MSFIDLLPEVERRQRRTDRLNYFTLVGGIATISAALVLALLLVLFDQLYRINLTALQAEQARAEAQVAQNLDVEKQATNLESRLADLVKAHEQSTDWAVLLTELRAATTPGVTVDSITVPPQQADDAPAGQAPTPDAEAPATQLDGLADSRRTLGEFHLALTGSPYFQDVKIQSSALEEESGLVRYSINLVVEYDKLAGQDEEQT